MSRIVLTPAQESAVEQMLASPSASCLNISPMGAGKTAMSAEVIKRLQAETVLIIAPLGVEKSWRDTLTDIGVTLPFRKIASTSTGLEAFQLYQFQDPGVYFVGTQLFQRWSWDGRKRTTAWSNIIPDVVIFDESHRAQNRTSKTYKSLSNLNAKKYRMCLSATPTGNSWQGAWSTAHWLFPEAVPPYLTWERQYCRTEYDPFSYSKTKVIGERNPGEFYSSLPCVIKVEPITENQTIHYSDQLVPMLTRQREIYDRFENQLVAFLDENPLTAEVPIAHRIRLRQIALGVPYITEDDEVDFRADCESAKIEAVIDFISKTNRPVLIGTHSKKFARVLNYRINKLRQPEWGRVISELWTGDTSQARREQVKQDFIDGTICYVVATIPSMAEGIDGFQYATNNILLVSRDDNRMLMEQFIGRVNRTGQAEEVWVHELKTQGSIDEGIYSKQVLDALHMRESLQVGVV